MKNNLYKIENLKFSYKLGSQTIAALDSLSLNIAAGTLIAISGPSGSGKSTLLNLLGLIEPVQEGVLLFRERDVRAMSEKERNQIRKHEIGFIFQQFHLIPVLTAEENVKYFLIKQGLSKAEVNRRAQEALELVGLWEHRNQKPGQLSGGQRQRVAIARAIAKQPKVIIADEPTANLDQKTGREVMDILKKMVKEMGVSVIITTHDPMVQSYCDTNIHIQDGQLQ